MLRGEMVSSLVDMCVKKWVDNVWLLGDVGETDDYLLDRMLPLCSVNQLMHVEASTKGRDLSPVTDKLWKKFYEKQFSDTDEVIENMRKKQVSFKWMQVYKHKVEEIKALEQIVIQDFDYEYDSLGAVYDGLNLKRSEEEEDEDEANFDYDYEYDDDDEEEEEEEEEETQLEDGSTDNYDDESYGNNYYDDVYVYYDDDDDDDCDCDDGFM